MSVPPADQDAPNWLDDAAAMPSPPAVDLAALLAPDPGPEPAPASADAVPPAPAEPGPLVYQIVLTVPAGGADGLRVTHTVPDGLRVVGTNPVASAHDGGRRLEWRLDRAAEGDQIRLRIKAEPTGPGAWAADDLAAFEVALVRKVRATAPLLVRKAAVAVSGPASVPLGATAALTVRVANTGNWPLVGVTVRVLPADGLEPLGPAVPVGDVPAGGEAAAVVRVRTSRPGPRTIRVEAAAAGGECPATADHACTVTAAEVAVRLAGPGRWSVNREHRLTASVTNVGTEAAVLVAARLAMPAGWEPVAPPGRYDAAAGELFWGVDRLDPGASSDVTLAVRPVLPGGGAIVLTAEAIGTAAASAECPVEAVVDPSDGDDVLDRFARGAGGAGPAAAADAPPAPAAGRDHQHVVFAVARTEYAVPLAAVLEVGRPPAATPVPHASGWLAGVANVRGDVVSLVDLRAFLDEPAGAPSPDRRMIVVRSTGGEVTAGLVVDRVRGLREVSPAAVAAPAGPVAAAAADYMTGVATLGGRTVAVLDPDRLLLAPAFRPFDHG